MNHNLLPSDRAAIAGSIDPDNASAGTYTTAWVSMATFRSVMAIVAVGVMTSSGTLDAKLQQATDSSGTGAKDVTDKDITQLTQAGTDSDKQVVINCRASELDIANGFDHVRLSVTTATAASYVCGILLGMDPAYGVASDNDETSVDEIVV